MCLQYHLCSAPTRALLLSTYVKYINLFPEIKAQIQDVLHSDNNLRSADAELQQRASEYLSLSTHATTDVLVSDCCNAQSSASLTVKAHLHLEHGFGS